MQIEARLFAIGSACFALGAVPGYASLVGTTATGITFFVGSIFFTTAGALQWIHTDRGDRAAWWSSGIQSVGTLFFNANTALAMVDNLSPAQQDRYVWRPDAIGSACFLISSGIALKIAGSIPRDRQIAWLNFAGSIAFGVSAVAAYVIPDSGEVKNAAVANLGTFLGALGFLAAALITPRVARPAARPG